MVAPPPRRTSWPSAASRAVSSASAGEASTKCDTSCRPPLSAVACDRVTTEAGCYNGCGPPALHRYPRASGRSLGQPISALDRTGTLRTSLTHRPPGVLTASKLRSSGRRRAGERRDAAAARGAERVEPMPSRDAAVLQCFASRRTRTARLLNWEHFTLPAVDRRLRRARPARTRPAYGRVLDVAVAVR